MIGVTSHERAYLAPFFAFLALLLVGEVVKSLGEGYSHWALASPQYWLFPLQIVVCCGLLVHYRRWYADLRPNTRLGLALGFGVMAGIIAFFLWISPQALFGAAPRVDGFHPHFFGSDGPAYWGNLLARFFRMVLVVPIVEELFWRGFLLRYCIRDDFQAVPFGTFTWTSFLVVSVAFCFEHTRPDWAAALVTSVLYNVVAYASRSLLACVIAHAVTNLVLGFYILKTEQWGFW